MTLIRKLALALFLALLSASYSNSQNLDPVTGTELNSTGNVLNLGGGLPWTNTVTGTAGGVSGGKVELCLMNAEDQRAATLTRDDVTREVAALEQQRERPVLEWGRNARKGSERGLRRIGTKRNQHGVASMMVRD